MEMLFAIIVMSVVVEGVVDIVKNIFVDKSVAWQKIVAIVIGEVVAIGFNLDLFVLFGMASIIPCLGSVLTGLLISRGSNYIADLIKKIQSYQTTKVNG